MRIFVAGATGAIGQRLVALLVFAGHAVVGLTRTPAKATLVRSLGAEPAVADGLDAKAIRDAVAAAEPEVIVHQMTDLRGADLRNFDRAFRTSNRLRTEGTDHLMAAAKAAGVKRLVAQSFCGWPYARTGGPVKSEADPLDRDPPKSMASTLAAIRHLESAVTRSFDTEGIVLRYGAFYGPDTGLFDHAFYGPDTGLFDQAFIAQVRRRRAPIIGDGNGWWSFVHIDDAAAATVLAIERGKAGNIYNIVDDDPARVRDWLPALARIIGAKPPFAIPAWIPRFLGAEHLVAMMTEARAGSNAKAKLDLGWQPAHPSWRRGFAEVASRRQPQPKAA